VGDRAFVAGCEGPNQRGMAANEEVQDRCAGNIGVSSTCDVDEGLKDPVVRMERPAPIRSPWGTLPD
jgi:hypothetical protein